MSGKITDFVAKGGSFRSIVEDWSREHDDDVLFYEATESLLSSLEVAEDTEDYVEMFAPISAIKPEVRNRWDEFVSYLSDDWYPFDQKASSSRHFDKHIARLEDDKWITIEFWDRA